MNLPQLRAMSRGPSPTRLDFQRRRKPGKPGRFLYKMIKMDVQYTVCWKPTWFVQTFVYLSYNPYRSVGLMYFCIFLLSVAVDISTFRWVYRQSCNFWRQGVAAESGFADVKLVYDTRQNVTISQRRHSKQSLLPNATAPPPQIVNTVIDYWIFFFFQ